MNKLMLVSAGLSLLLLSCGQNSEEANTATAEVVEETAAPAYEIFGDENMTPDNVLEADELFAMLETTDSANVKIAGVITECCQKKGCWMDLELANGKSMLVRFQDYEFFVPMNSAGKETIIEGMAKRQVLDVDWLRHQAEDAGKSAEEIAAITEPEERLTFMATGVLIK
ncbi:MAG: DUF4920 domain-containing protein [Schleiferiaceae bacterium]|nr:DUF4920 domain-containing protein [Schleiferiaceae bacterium]